MTEWLLQFANDTQYPGIHVWQSPPTVILGMKDTRLPQLQQGLHYLKQQQLHVNVRFSGGLAVMSDPGILNISLFIPHQKTTYTIDDCYNAMVNLITTLFPKDFKLYTGEITHSYCPGTYDLSHQGIKFAGMSQRRLKNASVVMLYIGLSGDQHQRNTWIKTFYQKAQADSSYPDIHDHAMATIQHWLPDILTPTTIDAILSSVCVQTNEQQQWQQWQQRPDAQRLYQHLEQRFEQKQQRLV